MKIEIADLMRALDDLEHIGRKVFDVMEPLWDEDERTFKRALAVLHEHIRELSQP